jgi:hypothetical protein
MSRALPALIALVAACAPPAPTALPPGARAPDGPDRAAALGGLPGLLLVDVLERTPDGGAGPSVIAAHLRLWQADLPQEAQSDTVGRARWEGLSAGAYQIEVRHPCFRPRRVSTQLTPDAGTLVQIALEPHPEPPTALHCGHPRRLIEPETAWRGVVLGQPAVQRQPR